MPACPHCSLSIEDNSFLNEWYFGYRGLYVQSWCRACKNGRCGNKSPCGSCQEQAIWRRARLLHNISLEDAVANLGLAPTDKGRYGRAVERLLGLPHGHNAAEPDWYGVEIKAIAMVSTGRQGSILRVKDKIFVCSENQDPIKKLRRVLFVFFDYESKMVVNIGKMIMDKALYSRLKEDYIHRVKQRDADLLFLNTKGAGNDAPKTYAWYLCPSFFLRCGFAY